MDLKHGDRAVSGHEGSKQHHESMIVLMTLGSMRRRRDAQLVEACESERQNWRDVLSRVVVVMMFLSERGLPFRGHSEIIGSATNGNYIE